ncbi:hypothetical protein AB9K34_00065 [Sedimentitalea sp. XS_ASV28]|uniref:hypothetical protein n=1 Tax=Sedimentitalea sp. XS_ASV28 TaxID=3241296 RepID=UPI00351804F3
MKPKVFYEALIGSLVAAPILWLSSNLGMPIIQLISFFILVSCLLTIFVFLAIAGSQWYEEMMKNSTIYGSLRASDEIKNKLPLFRKVFPKNSPLDAERKSLRKEMQNADETKVMDDTSELCDVLDIFYEKVKLRVRELGEDKIFSRSDFMFFAMNVSEEQLDSKNG